MRSLWLSWVLATLILAPVARADEYLIQEVSKVLKTLDAKDPSRPALTLHLADLYFDEASDMFRKETLNGKISAKIADFRQKALKGYYDVLYGFSGQFPKPEGERKYKVQFQIGRLHSDAGNVREALPIFEELAQQKKNSEIAREASLRAAEIYEARDGQPSFVKAKQYFEQGLSLCNNTDACSYSEYRLAWLHYRRSDFAKAIPHMERALFDHRGKPRDEAIRDYIVILGHVPGSNGQEALAQIQKLADKLNRPGLVEELAMQFYASGNRAAGVMVLEKFDENHVNVSNTIRLMEDNYALRNWENYQKHLSRAQKLLTAETRALLADNTREDGMEAEKILRRLTVQLDGERTTRSEHTGLFQDTVDLYVAYFPQSKERNKMADGWLASETNAGRKIDRLVVYINEAAEKKDLKRELELREMRAALGQKEKKFDVVAQEMAVLAAKSADASKREEYDYNSARAQYELKNLDQALPIFSRLSQVSDKKMVPSSFAVQSLHLTLDIYGQRKDYAAVEALGQAWLQHPEFEKWTLVLPKHRQELLDIRKIVDEARFEKASTSSDKQGALASFMSLCKEDRLKPQSCDNAKVLAVQQKDQDALIAILKLQGAKEQLAQEYEASGQWLEAAAMMDAKLQSQKKIENKEYLKLALLYELGQKNDQRDRVLKELKKSLAAKKQMPAGEEDLIYETLKDANLLDAATWSLSWQQANRMRLADYLQGSGRATADIKNFVVKSCERTGPTWTKLALEKMRLLDAVQARIQFTGRNSQNKFEKRVASMQELVKAGQCYLQGALPAERVVMADLLARSHGQLAEAIENSPIPEGLPEESVAQIKESLKQMGAPFAEKKVAYKKLASEQVGKIEDASQRAAYENYLSSEGLSSALPSVVENSDAKPVALNQTLLDQAQAQLRANPENANALVQLKEVYKDNGNRRLQAYFEGRLNSLKKGAM